MMPDTDHAAEIEELKALIAAPRKKRPFRPPKTLIKLMLDEQSFFRIVLGPWGSGKTYTLYHEVLNLISREMPDERGVRSSKVGIIRNTYPELISTTIATFVRFFDPAMYTLKLSPPPMAKLKFRLTDGTFVDSQFEFLALDGQGVEGKLKSWEISHLFFNELSEIKLEYVAGALGRLGRFPEKIFLDRDESRAYVERFGLPDERWLPDDEQHSTPDAIIYQATRPCAVGDSNMTPRGHWLEKAYRASMRGEPIEGAEDVDMNWTFYRQPGGVIKDSNGRYHVNPEAENLENLTGGGEYYKRALPGMLLKNRNMVDVWLGAQFGRVIGGKPIFEHEFNEAVHVSEFPLVVVPDAPLLIGYDFGLHPAAIVMQYIGGQIRVHDEIVPRKQDVRAFFRDEVKPFLAARHGKHRGGVEHVGDATGAHDGGSKGGGAFAEAREEGIIVIPAPDTRQPKKVWADARWFMTTGTPVKPNLQINRRCTWLIEALAEKYHLPRIQTSGDDPLYNEKAVKNDWSHPAEAFCYACNWLRAGYEAATVGPEDHTLPVMPVIPPGDAVLGM